MAFTEGNHSSMLELWLSGHRRKYLAWDISTLFVRPLGQEMHHLKGTLP